jgi:DNA-3-methyladenine glycosylase
MAFLGTDFFERDVLVVARDLVGVELVWQGCSGIIVETEAYAAEGDPACHTATRPSAREFMRRQPPGAAYVYFNYGMHWLFNLLVKGGGCDGLILVRALEPRRGVALMRERRGRDRLEDLCSGPGKLALALGMAGSDHGIALAGRGRPAGCGLHGAGERRAVVADVRVGIRQAADYPWRFLAPDSPHVSVPFGRVKPPR